LILLKSLVGGGDGDGFMAPSRRRHSSIVLPRSGGLWDGDGGGVEGCGGFGLSGGWGMIVASPEILAHQGVEWINPKTKAALKRQRLKAKKEKATSKPLR